MAAFTQSFGCFWIHVSCIRPYLLKALQSHVGLIQFILKLRHFVLQLTFEALQRRYLAGGRSKGVGRERRRQGREGQELSMMLHLYTYCSVTNDVISLLIGWYSLMSALRTPPPTLPFPVSSCGSPHATSVHMHTHTHMKGDIYYKFLH